MKVIANLSGMNANILRKICICSIRPAMEYGAEIFNMSKKNSLRGLQIIQNAALRKVCGVPPWTSTVGIHRELQILPVCYSVEIAQAAMVDKIVKSKDHPLRARMRLAVTRRDNKKGYKPYLMKLSNTYRKLAVIHKPDMIPVVHRNVPPWSERSIIIMLEKYTDAKKCSTTNTLKDQAMTCMLQTIRDDDYIIYTDGSVADSRTAAAFVTEHSSIGFRLNDGASILQAELAAIHAALLHSADIENRVVIFVDSLAALQAIHTPTDNISLIYSIHDVAQRHSSKPVLQWIPSHVGIAGNEYADTAAKHALRRNTIDVIVSKSQRQIKSRIKHTAADIYDILSENDSTKSGKKHRMLVNNKRTLTITAKITPRFIQKEIYKIRLHCRSWYQIKYNLHTCVNCDEDITDLVTDYMTECLATHSRASACVINHQLSSRMTI